MKATFKGVVAGAVVAASVASGLFTSTSTNTAAGPLLTKKSTALAPDLAVTPGAARKQIVFDRGDECVNGVTGNDGSFSSIWTVSPDGSHLRRLIGAPTPPCKYGDNGPTWPRWSPDRRAIVYSDVHSGLGRICVIAADGSRRHCLPAFGETPTWVDGKRIAYADFEVRIIGLNAKHSVPACGGCDFESLDVSPDGKKLAGISGGLSEGVFIRDLSARVTQRLTRNEFDNLPRWSPDGQKLLFSRRSDLYVVKRDGSGLKRLIHLGGHLTTANGLDWAPDGRSIAWTDDRDGPPSIHFLDLSAGRTRTVRLPGTGGGAGDLDW
jgi:dipeptidyl aminopeptidase/acylaminoacyl peptidase